MKRRRIWVTLHRLKVHEIQRTIRLLESPSENWQRVYRRLSEIQDKATRATLKLGSSFIFLILFLRVFSAKEEVIIRISDLNISIPFGFVAVFVGITFFCFCAAVS